MELSPLGVSSAFPSREQESLIWDWKEDVLSCECLKLSAEEGNISPELVTMSVPLVPHVDGTWMAQRAYLKVKLSKLRVCANGGVSRNEP